MKNLHESSIIYGTGDFQKFEDKTNVLKNNLKKEFFKDIEVKQRFTYGGSLSERYTISQHDLKNYSFFYDVDVNNEETVLFRIRELLCTSFPFSMVDIAEKMRMEIDYNSFENEIEQISFGIIKNGILENRYAINIKSKNSDEVVDFCGDIFDYFVINSSTGFSYLILDLSIRRFEGKKGDKRILVLRKDNREHCEVKDLEDFNKKMDYLNKVFDENGYANVQDYSSKKCFIFDTIGEYFIKDGIAHDDLVYGNPSKKKATVEIPKEELDRYSFYYESSALPVGEDTAHGDKYGYEAFMDSIVYLGNPFEWINCSPFEKVKSKALFTAYEEQKDEAGYRIRLEGEDSTLEFYGNIYDYHITDFSDKKRNRHFYATNEEYDYLILSVYGSKRPRTSARDRKPDILVIRRKRRNNVMNDFLSEKEFPSMNMNIKLPKTNIFYYNINSEGEKLKVEIPKTKIFYHKLSSEDEEAISSFSGKVFSRNKEEDKKEGENKMKDRLSTLMPERVSKGVALSINGSMAVRTRSGSYVSFNKETGQIEDHMDFVFGENKMADFCFLMPVERSTIKVGDVVVTNNGYGFVVEKNEATGDITCVDATDATKAEVIPVKNILTNTTMVKKLITLFGDIAQGSGGINPMLFMLMDKEGEGNNSDNMMKYLLMSQMMGGDNANNFGGINPLMFMLM